MNFIKYILLTTTIICLTLSPALADELFSLKLGFQHLTPDGDFAVSADSLGGTTVNIDDDLELDDSDDFSLEAALQLGSFRLSAAYLPISFSGNSILTNDTNFNGETFVANSHVKSNVDLDIYEAGLCWHLVNIDDLPTRIQLGPELAVKYIDAKIEIEDIIGTKESESVRAAVPTIGLRGRLAIGDSLGVVGRAGYLEYDNNAFLDIDVQVEYSPLPMVGIFAGYRYLDIDIDKDDVMLNATFDGPYVGALIRF